MKKKKKLKETGKFGAEFTKGADSTFSRLSSKKIDKDHQLDPPEDDHDKDRMWDDTDEPDIMNMIDVYNDVLSNIDNENWEDEEEEKDEE